MNTHQYHLHEVGPVNEHYINIYIYIYILAVVHTKFAFNPLMPNGIPNCHQMGRSSFAIILIRKEKLVALLCLSSWCLVIVV